MSRGYGRTERAILAALAGGGGGHYSGLARLAYSVNRPTRAQLVAVRRAVGTLAAAGMVSLEYSDYSASRRPIVRLSVISPPAGEQHLEPEAGPVSVASASSAAQHLEAES